MLEVFKEWFIRWKCRKEFNRIGFNNLEKPEKISTVAIVLDEKLGIDEGVFIKFASLLKVAKSKVSVLLYADKNLQLPNTKLKRQRIGYDDITLFGKVGTDTNEFFRNDYDLVLNYFNRSNMILKLLSLKCKGKFRVGFGNVDHRLNDLILDFEPRQTEQFLQESIKYLRIIFND